MPLQSPGVRPALHPHAQLDVMPHQVAEHGADRTEFVELVEDQRDDELDQLVGVQGDPVAGQPDVASGNHGEQLTTAGLVQPPVIEPLLQEVQLGLGHSPFQPHQQPIVVQGRVIDAVLVGQEGVENYAPLQKTIPVGVGPGQSTDLEAKDDSDVLEVHLGQEPLEAQSAVAGGAGFRLIVGDDDHPVGWPAPDDGEVAQAGCKRPVNHVFKAICGRGIMDGVPSFFCRRSPVGARPSASRDGPVRQEGPPHPRPGAPTGER